jgi:hypothetical protein
MERVSFADAETCEPDAGGRLALTWLFVTHVVSTPWLVVGFTLAVTLAAAALVTTLGVARGWVRRRRRVHGARIDRL